MTRQRKIINVRDIRYIRILLTWFQLKELFLFPIRVFAVIANASTFIIRGEYSNDIQLTPRLVKKQIISNTCPSKQINNMSCDSVSRSRITAPVILPKTNILHRWSERPQLFPIYLSPPTVPRTNIGEKNRPVPVINRRSLILDWPNATIWNRWYSAETRHPPTCGGATLKGQICRTISLGVVFFCQSVSSVSVPSIISPLHVTSKSPELSFWGPPGSAAQLV